MPVPLLNSSRLENSKLKMKVDLSSADLLEPQVLWARVSSAALPTWGSFGAEVELWLGVFPSAIALASDVGLSLYEPSGIM